MNILILEDDFVACLLYKNMYKDCSITVVSTLCDFFSELKTKKYSLIICCHILFGFDVVKSVLIFLKEYAPIAIISAVPERISIEDSDRKKILGIFNKTDVLMCYIDLMPMLNINPHLDDNKKLTDYCNK